ncbi:TM2 domain-containing protein [Raoultibacter phocaeensis]|uniref:TM2 domain-containing protein n=1 Tax=Raoultibacter phocaeensis TaxID=2479841 RepID=UPI001117BB25|nr:TM2 domain-containing protein [Raoultibacter phocaeensis]
MDTNTNDAKPSIADEIAAAEAELRAAQERLDAAKAKASLEEGPAEQAEADEEPVAAESETIEAEVVEATVVASGPIELEAEPVPAPDASNADPNWVPYTPDEQSQSVPQEAVGSCENQTPPPPPVGSYESQAQSAGEQPQGGYYWQQPQQDGYSTQYGYNTQYAPPQNPYDAHSQQQYYYQQPYAPVVSSKDHVAAGLLAIFLGSLGIHKFYLGYNTAGFIMLAVTILGGLFTFGLAAAVMGVIAFIEGILYLIKSQSEFEQIYVFNKREWF